MLIPYINGWEEDLMKYVQKSDEFWSFEQNAFEFNDEKELRSEQSDEAAVSALNRLLKSPTARNILKKLINTTKVLYPNMKFFWRLWMKQ